MATDINEVTLTGRTHKDVLFRKHDNGEPFVMFLLVVDDGYKHPRTGKYIPRTRKIPCCCTGNKAYHVGYRIGADSKIRITGKITDSTSAKHYKNNYYMLVLIDEIFMLDVSYSKTGAINLPIGFNEGMTKGNVKSLYDEAYKNVSREWIDIGLYLSNTTSFEDSILYSKVESYSKSIKGYSKHIEEAIDKHKQAIHDEYQADLVRRGIDPIDALFSGSMQSDKYDDRKALALVICNSIQRHYIKYKDINVSFVKQAIVEDKELYRIGEKVNTSKHDWR